MTFDPATIMAYVDDELDDVTARRIEKAMEDDLALAAAIERQRALRNRLSARFDPVLTEAVPDHLLDMLGNVDRSLDERRGQREPKRWQFGAAQWGAMAASLVLGLYLGHASLTGSSWVVGNGQGTLVAQGELERVLDTRLASLQPADAATRIGLTFRDRQGTICRTFDASSLSGIACRRDDEWHLRQMVANGGPQGEYRQAGSPAVTAAAAEIMAGEALDAHAEAEARAKGWR